ncbi:MAG: hypothetical protein FWE27_08725 [Defluviitaleaceae bacterium]|nr:hypothetical protein [Defluviitaleaceae bacterium]
MCKKILALMLVLTMLFSVPVSATDDSIASQSYSFICTGTNCAHDNDVGEASPDSISIGFAQVGDDRWVSGYTSELIEMLKLLNGADLDDVAREEIISRYSREGATIGFAQVGDRWVSGYTDELQVMLEQHITENGWNIIENHTHAATCTRHIFGPYVHSGNLSSSTTHTVYLPGGNPVPCIITTTHEVWIAACSVCGFTDKQFRNPRVTHSINHN